MCHAAWGIFIEGVTMDLSLLLWLVLALLLFWGVGLYNRLMRLRARSLEVLGVVEKHASSCAALAKQYVATPNDEGQVLVDAHWLKLHAAAARWEQVLALPRPTPLQPGAVAALSAAWTAMHVAWLEAIEGPTDLAGPAMPPEMEQAWTAASLKVQSASGGFNQIIARYNEAIQQYPARWVAALMGFHAAGPF
jgi:LemA protein